MEKIRGVAGKSMCFAYFWVLNWHPGSMLEWTFLDLLLLTLYVASKFIFVRKVTVTC